MNKKWIIFCLIISFILMANLKSQENRSLAVYFRPDKILKLSHFQKHKNIVSADDLELLKLWESILTGRSAPLSGWMKERYKALGLSHIFTPSGFHLSSVLLPVMKIVKNIKYQLLFLILLLTSLTLISGFTALKRMLLVKIHQRVLGIQIGFLSALFLDIIFGSFQQNTLSFTYSFLFLGIIYSGASGVSLVIWFYIAQVIISYFQNTDLSLLLLIFSPILNAIFAFAMPILFVLTFPLWEWQLHCGLFILRMAQWLVDALALISTKFPTYEIHIFTLVIFYLCISQKRKLIVLSIILFSHSLNLDHSKCPSSLKEFVPTGKTIATLSKKNYQVVVFSDGYCRMKLVRGFWWESCSPRRESKRKKSIKKLSYPS